MRRKIKFRLAVLFMAASITALTLTSCVSKPAAEEKSNGGNTITESLSTTDSSMLSTGHSTETTQTEVSTSNSANTTKPQNSKTTKNTEGTTINKNSTTSGQKDPRYIFYKNLIEQESDWLASLQLDNGSIPMRPTQSGIVKVSPYFSDFAALALLESGKKYADKVKKYMDWHFARINTAEQDPNGVDGTIFDYNEHISDYHHAESEEILVIDGKKIYDSTDSYAALFLSVLWHYYEKTGDSSYIVAQTGTINRIVNALFSTMDNGLTLATPAYPVKYLMDNAEVYQGLCDASKLYSKVLVKETAKLNQINTGRDSVKNKIQTKMWSEEQGGHYYAALNKNESPFGFSWDTFYADATCQVFVITNGVVSPASDRAKLVYNNFNKYWSTGDKNHSWEKFDTTDSFYWGELAYAAALMGDINRVNAYMDIYMKYPGKNHNYPLYNADCAKVIRASYIMLNYYN